MKAETTPIPVVYNKFSPGLKSEGIRIDELVWYFRADSNV